MSKTNYEIKTITKSTADIFLVQHGIPVRSGTRYYGLFHRNGLVGVAVFNSMSSQNTAKGCFGLENTSQMGFYEVGRFVVDTAHNVDGVPTLFLSECIERFCNELETKALFAYLDPAAEDSTPFTGNGFDCYGLTPRRSDFYEKLEDGSYKMHSRGKPQGVAGEWRPRPQKGRLLRIFDENLTATWVKTS